MEMSGWLIFFLIIQVIHFLATWKLYVKAGRKAWEAAIPIYNGIVLMQIIKRPKWWIFLLFIPIINLLMFPVIWVETIRSFGRNSRLETILVIITLGFYTFYVNYALDVKYAEDRSLNPRSSAGEWISSIVFAIVAATLVHTYFMQPYTIPTSSLEKTLLIGDFLFVSKFHYGARAPMTTVATPMLHDTVPAIPVPFTDIKLTPKFRSYLKKPQLPYFRIPGFQKIKRNDIVVFSWPVDTVQQFFKRPDRKIRKPIDKKSNYVKRCVAIAGDSLEIRDGYVYINGERTKLPDRAKPQFYHYLKTKSSPTALIEKYDIREYTYENRFKFKRDLWDNPKMKVYYSGLEKNNRAYLIEYDRDSLFVYLKGAIVADEADKLKLSLISQALKVNVTEEIAKKIKNDNNVISIEKFIEEGTGNVFPRVKSLEWNNDNFGPIYMPEKGKTVKLDKESLPFYKRIIREYEKNTLEVKGDEILINGVSSDSYTFEQDYYWMMGDNRHNSEDARVWGYVPFDHVVGKPVFIWFSWNTNGKGINKVRWERLFTTVGGDGEPVSYFRYFLIALAGWFVFDYFRKRRKNA